MTIGIVGDGWHMETHDGGIQTVAAGASYDATVTLDKPGRFMGVMAFLKSTDAGRDITTPQIINGSGPPLVYGDVITSVRFLALNNNPGAADMEMTIVVFIRT